VTGILRDWQRPRPHLKAAREQAAAALTDEERARIEADERCREIADYLDKRERARLEFVRWRWRRRRWDARLLDSEDMP